MKTSNKIIIIVGLIVLMLLKVLGAGNAETVEQWVFDPGVRVYTVDKVDEEHRYSAYYCIDEHYIITLERDILNDTGTITLYEDGIGNVYQTDWGGEKESRMIIDRLVTYIIESRNSE